MYANFLPQTSFEIHAPATPTHPTPPQQQPEGEGQGERDTLKAVRRRRKKVREVVDVEMEIQPKLFKEGLRDKGVGLRTPDYTKQVRGV